MVQKHNKNRKKNTFITVLAFFFATITLFSAVFIFPLTALADDSPTVENCKAFVLYDKTHQKYVVEKDGYSMVNTSTSAKIIMGLIACEKLEDRIDETVTITKEMTAESLGYSMDLEEGEKIKIGDLIYGAVCASYNDAAYALAHIIGGSSANFVEMMNTRALELGAKNTNYTNPLGYPDNPSMLTTAYDTLKIALAASENEFYMTVSSTPKYTVQKNNLTEKREFKNRNNLISSAQDSIYSGMNAGNSGEAGGCSIVTLVNDDGAQYICVLLGGKDNEPAYNEVKKQVNYVCNKYNNKVLYEKGDKIAETKIGLTSISTNNAPCVAKEDITVYVTDDSSALTTEIKIDENIKAPITAGTTVGKILIYQDGKKVGEGELILSENYEANEVMKAIDKVGEYTKSRAFLFTLVIFGVLLTIALLLRFTKPNMFSKKKYKKYK